MASSATQQAASGPPYPPQGAQLGGLPTPDPDDIVCGVLLLFYVVSAASNMTIFQLNRRRGHKFVFSGLLFGFSMARIVALVMRIVWASRPNNISIAIAANIFTAAGVLLLFIVNLIFAQRIVRACHPSFGWHRTVTLAFRFFLFCIPALLIMVIVTTVHSFYTLDATAHDMERKVQLFVATYLAVLAFLPIPITIIATLYPRRNRVEKFGSGSFRTKLMLLLFTATLLSIGAWFRVGVNFSPRPSNAPAWYHHKACYYCFNYVIEIIVVYTYLIARFDHRFHVPDGSSRPGDYLGMVKETEGFGLDENDSPTGDLEGQQWAVEARDEISAEQPATEKTRGEATA